ncbi:helix-turn-helix transcriptional regulator [Emticicia sp. C21]|uniref:helix-turn-helix transcriptional regulator n=1 Tax=Emticicia sp. C21 TaxID=2302915 RepID=UPI000E35747F|nr:helix-turn-helix transcriptional regulator [Emticicia sp. C21]RFS17210.1 XRE family transcriptional regulator [Emticicia sp. C21]
MNYEKLRAKIKSHLAIMDITESKLAQEIGMTRQGYSKMWKQKSVSLDTLDQIADFINIPLWQLIAETKINHNETEDYKLKYFQAVEFIAKKLGGMPSFSQGC